MILSGHTHGGQIRLPGLTLYTPPGSGRYVSGWYRDTLAPLYVSRGIGTATIRMRFFCPPELPVFTLRRSIEPSLTRAAFRPGSPGNGPHRGA